MPSTHIYEYSSVSLKFSRLAGVTGHWACPGIGRNCEHCHFEFDSRTGRIYVQFVRRNLMFDL